MRCQSDGSCGAYRGKLEHTTRDRRGSVNNRKTSVQPTLDELVTQAKALSEAERELLVLRIQQTLQAPDPGVEQAWDEEIPRRIADMESGKSVGVPWEKVRERLGL